MRMENPLGDEYVDSTERESIIERLMKTTTKNPLKKKVDQGMEYSDYYNDENLSFGSSRIDHSLRKKFNDASLDGAIGNHKFLHDRDRYENVASNGKGIDGLKNLIRDLEKITNNHS